MSKRTAPVKKLWCVGVDEAEWMRRPTGRYVTLNDRVSSYMPRINISDRTKCWISNYLFFIATVQAVPTLILALRVAATGETDGLYPLAFYAQIFISVSWILYGGLVLREFQIVLASSLLLVVSVALLVLIYRARAAAGGR